MKLPRILLSVLLIYVAIAEFVGGQYFYRAISSPSKELFIERMTRSTEWAPWEVDAWYYLGDQAFSAKRYELCISSMQNVEKLNGSWLLSDFLIAASYYELGRCDLALPYIHNALILYPYHKDMQELLRRCL